MTTRTFKSVAESISPIGIITLNHEERKNGHHVFTLVSYGAGIGYTVNRELSPYEVAIMFGGANQTLRGWIMKKTGRDAVQIMAHIK